MISLKDKQNIIIGHFLEGKSQWEIHRQEGFDRKTIRKYIKQYEESKQKLLDSSEDNLILTEELVEPPKYDVSNRTKTKLTDVIMDKIDFYLKENETKRQIGRSKQQKKKIDIHECLVDEGYDIGYQTVCNYVKNKLNEQKEAYIRQEYELGDVVEFDWGHVNLTIDGSPKNLQIAVFTTAKGNFRFAYLYHNQKMESFLDSHVKFFNEVGGVHKTVVYDNMKVAVKKFVSRTEKEPTEDLLKLSMYYGFKYRFCNARRGNEKGHVEKSVEYVRRKAFNNMDNFKTLEDANIQLNKSLEKLNNKPLKYYDNKSSKDVLIEEIPHLIKLMPSYDIARISELRVDKYSVISIDENKYSVADSLVGKFVTAKIYPQNILIYHNNVKVAEHVRNFGSHTWNIKIEHYLKTLKKKPGAIHSSTAMQQMNPKLQTIYNKHYTENAKEFIELIEIISEKGLEKIEEIIKELEKINPLGVNTEKIKLLSNRSKEEYSSDKKEENTEIESNSRAMLSQYASILNGSDVAFDEEAMIIWLTVKFMKTSKSTPVNSN